MKRYEYGDAGRQRLELIDDQWLRGLISPPSGTLL